MIQVATGPCTTVKPEADYQGAALQHLLHKVKKFKTQKQSCISMLNDSSVSFCNITNCVGNVTMKKQQQKRNENRSAQKADPGEENYPATPAGTRTGDLSITSPAL